MTSWKDEDLPAPETADAVRRLCECLTPRDKELLKIERNGQVATVEAQLIARWWNYLPRATTPTAFKAQVLQILSAHGRLLDLLEKIKQHDIFAALLDPDNYKFKSLKKGRVKILDKRLADVDQATANVVKTVARTVGGTGAIDRAYDYGKDWDEADRKRLDAISFKKSDNALLKTESGEEDDSPLPAEEDWIDRKERLDQVQGRRLSATKSTVKFANIPEDGIKENDILLFDARLAQNTNATAGETELSTNSFIEGLRRQNFESVREQVILADAIKNIQNIEFLDIREKLYKYFDPLFYLGKPRCQ